MKMIYHPKSSLELFARSAGDPAKAGCLGYFIYSDVEATFI